MRLGSSNILGLSFGDTSIACAELHLRRGAAASASQRNVRKTASFVFAPAHSLDKPQEMGQALSKFLKQNGFGASHVICGVPARWLIAMERDIPPASESQVVQMLRLQAERMSVVEGGDVVYDYAGTLNGGEAGKALLVGILRKQLNRIQEMIEAAGLTLVGVTSTALTLAAVVTDSEKGTDPEASMVMVGRHGAEVVWRRKGVPRMLRHVTMGGAATSTTGNDVPIDTLGSELRRAVAMGSPLADGKAATGAGTVADATRSLMMWDMLGLSAQQLGELSGRLGLPVKHVGTKEALGLAANLNGEADLYAPALSLALAGARRALPLDWAHSRLVALPKPKISRAMLWSIIIGSVLLISLVSLYMTVHSRQSDLDAITADLRALEDPTKAAQAEIDRITYGRGYFDKRSPALLCLREVTTSIRDDDPIWVTGFTYRDTGAVQLNGKATDQPSVVRVVDRLLRNPHFRDPRLIDVRDAGSRTKEVSFAITFTYLATPPPAGNSKPTTAPAAAPSAPVPTSNSPTTAPTRATGVNPERTGR